MSTDDNTSKTDSQESNEFIGLREFFSLFVKIISTLAGLAALFVLLGYMIILSFVSRMKLYGLTSFPQEFYKEATVKFISDMLESYGQHPYCSLIMAILIGAAVWVSLRFENTFSGLFKTVTRFVIAVCILLVTLLSLKLDSLPERFCSISGTKKVILFMISMPVLAGIFAYIALRFKDFIKSTYRFYYLMILLFLILFVSIPVGYGDNIFDMDIFPVTGFDYSDTARIESLKALKDDIDTQGEGTLFFLMGHTTDREIFFDNQALSPPARMVLIERSLIKFLKISRKNINTLRNILQRQQGIVPLVPQDRISNELPEDIMNVLNREKK